MKDTVMFRSIVKVLACCACTAFFLSPEPAGAQTKRSRTQDRTVRNEDGGDPQMGINQRGICDADVVTSGPPLICGPNGTVDGFDFNYIQQCVNSGGAINPCGVNCDINCDGVLNNQDIFAEDCVFAGGTATACCPNCAGTVTMFPQGPTTCPASPTACPIQFSVCPCDPTTCPEQLTECPKSMTECPQAPTLCEFSICPDVPTFCPQVLTMCPEIITACDIENFTFCDVVTPTVCSGAVTACVVEMTQCAPSPTVCPESEA
jgi:hypothetical protein